jgi:hypothetical protein
MFLSSALKAQEEHYKLHTAVSQMKGKQPEPADEVHGSQPTVKHSPEEFALAQLDGQNPVNSEAVRV